MFFNNWIFFSLCVTQSFCLDVQKMFLLFIFKVQYFTRQWLVIGHLGSIKWYVLSIPFRLFVCPKFLGEMCYYLLTIVINLLFFLLVTNSLLSTFLSLFYYAHMNLDLLDLSGESKFLSLWNTALPLVLLLDFKSIFFSF